MTRRRAHRRQGGQVVPITAIMLTLLIGAAALATDLSVNTHVRRNIQNVTDAAALAGAYDIETAATPTERRTAVSSAFQVVHDHLGWSTYQSASSYAASALGSVGGDNCGTSSEAVVCQVTYVADDTSYSVTVNTPPLHAHNTSYNGQQGYIEVLITKSSTNGFGAALGFLTGTEGGHSVGYHRAGNAPFGFALYSSSIVTSGNDNETVSGNVYAYRDLSPQSHGHAAICSATDQYGTKGHVVLGAPQSGPFPNPDPGNNQPYQSSVAVLTSVNSCSGVGGGSVAQTANLGACGTLQVQGVSMATTQDPGSLACMADPAVLAPDLQGPTLTGSTVLAQTAACTTVLHVTAPMTAGVYEIRHNPVCPAGGDVVIDSGVAGTCSGTYSGFDVCMIGVTFVLENGASIDVGGKVAAVIVPYTPASSTNPNDGKYPIYAPTGSAATLTTSKNGTLLQLYGTLYMPSGSYSGGQNAAVSIQGQAIVASWTVQSGNHTNPDITYDKSFVASEREFLLLVE